MNSESPLSRRNAGYERMYRTGAYPVGLHVFQEDVDKEKIIGRHWHRSIELTYRIRYKGCLYINRKKYEDLEDTVYVINSCDVHEIHTSPQKDMYAILVVLPYSFLLENIPQIDQLRFQVDPRDPIIRKLILEIGNEYLKNEPASYLKVTGLVYTLVYELMQRAQTASRSLLQNRKRLTEWERDVIRYTEQNLSEIPSAAAAAGHFGYSREAFSRKFREQTQMTYSDFLLTARLNKAREYLIHSEKSTQEIFRICGFKSLRSFRENFRAAYHQFPEDYRRNGLYTLE